MKPMIVWTILWGWCTGSASATCSTGWESSGRSPPGIVPTLIRRTDTAATATLLIVVSIGFGVIQVLHGFILKAQMSRRQGERKTFLGSERLLRRRFGPGPLRLRLHDRELSRSGCLCRCLGAALFVVGMLRARMPLMLAELPTQGGHILSYIRLYAVGLASAILADLATDIGFGFYQHGGSPGSWWGY